MKILVVVSAIAFCIPGIAQRFLEHTESSIQYSFMAPQGGMGRNIEMGHGVVASLLKKIPQTSLFLGIEINSSQYGGSRTRQTYTFENGTLADMDIIVRNLATNIMISTRYYPLSKATVQPYFTAKGGYSFYNTTLAIYDPNDQDHCAPIENEILQKDGALVGSLGAGFQTDMGSIFNSLGTNRFLFDMTVNYTAGGRVSYMNAQKPNRHRRGLPNDVTADFIDTGTQIVHTHHVGYLFSSRIELVEIRAGFSYRFGF